MSQARVKKVTLTSVQLLAIEILGYLPTGYVLVTEVCNAGAPYPVGHLYIDGKSIAMFRYLD